MIKAVVGGIGQGKSISAVKMIYDSPHISFCNFDVRLGKAVRMKKEHIIKEEVKRTTKSGKEILERKVNWEFWNKALRKHHQYNVVIDELHNIAHSRQSMTKWNTLFSTWISQVRKMIGDSETTDVILVSQRLGRIDVAFRDLLHLIVSCMKHENHSNLIKTKVWNKNKLVTKLIPETWILHHYFAGDNCVEKYEAFTHGGVKSYDFRSGYVCNPYIQLYNSYEVFGETAYL